MDFKKNTEYGSADTLKLGICEVESLVGQIRYNDAIVHAQRYLEKWPDNFLLRAYLAESYTGSERHKDAIDIYKVLVKTEDAPYWIFIGYAEALEKTGDLESAVKEYFCALKIHFDVSTIEKVSRLTPYLENSDVIVTGFREVASARVDHHEREVKIIETLYRYKAYNEIIEISELNSSDRQSSIEVIVALIKSKIRLGLLDDVADLLEKIVFDIRSDRRVRYLSRFVRRKIVVRPYKELLESMVFPEYYKCRVPLLFGADESVCREHYLATGVFSNIPPNPWFDVKYFKHKYSREFLKGEPAMAAYIRMESNSGVAPCQSFDPEYYREANPDLAQMPNMLSHYVNYGHGEGRLPKKTVLPAPVIAEYKAMIDLEPELNSAWDNLNNIVRYPKLKPSHYVAKATYEKFGGNIEVIICVPFVSCGGADLISTYLLKVVKEAYGDENVLFVVTDSKTIEQKQWVDKNTKTMFLENMSRYSDLEDKVSTLHDIVGYLQPKHICNVNSLVCWELYKNYGKQLSTVLSLFAYIFCHDYNQHRNRVGYLSEYLPKTLQYLFAVIADNRTVRDEIFEQYCFPGSYRNKFHVAYTPAENIVTKIQRNPPKSNDSILWIGRLSEQKRPDILIEISKRLIYRNFVVYGPPGNCKYGSMIMNGDFSNIEYRGNYRSISELDPKEYSMFLHTSEWEGLPTVLGQIMLLGIPVLTSNVGGVSELINSSNSYSVEDCKDVEAYIKQLNTIFRNYQEAVAKSKIAKANILNEFTFSNYKESIGNSGLLSSIASFNSKRDYA